MPPKANQDGDFYKKRRERFLRGVALRTNNVIVALRRLEHCGNRANYAYEPSEVDDMLKAIREAFDQCRDAFVATEAPPRREFSFKAAKGEK